MKTIRCICSACGAKLDVDEDKKTLICPYCGETVLIDDETVHIKHDDMEQAGYEFEKGRQKAIEENKQASTKQNSKKTKLTNDKNSRSSFFLGLLIVVLALAFFPIVVTFCLVKEKKFQPKVRYAIIAAAWLIWTPLVIKGMMDKSSGDNSTKATEVIENADTDAVSMIDVTGQSLDVAIENLKEIGITNIKAINSKDNEELTVKSSNFTVDTQSVTSGTEISKDDEIELVATIVEEPLIDNFIERLEVNLSTEITDLTEFDPHDAPSEWDRSEFLYFDGSEGKCGYLNGLPITMVQYGSQGQTYSSNDTLRVYFQFNENDIDTIYPAVVKAYNSDISDEDIQTAIDNYKTGGYTSFNSNDAYYMSIVSYSEEAGKILEVMLD